MNDENIRHTYLRFFLNIIIKVINNKCHSIIWKYDGFDSGYLLLYYYYQSVKKYYRCFNFDLKYDDIKMYVNVIHWQCVLDRYSLS